MKRKAWIIGVLLAVLTIGIIQDADAHRRGCRRGYGNRYRPHPVWIAPPPPPVVVVGPRNGYRNRYRHHYVRPHRHGYYDRSYSYRRPQRRW